MIDLAQLNILIYGESWYNRLGFVNDTDHEKNKEFNNTVINKTLNDLIVEHYNNSVNDFNIFSKDKKNKTLRQLTKEIYDKIRHIKDIKCSNSELIKLIFLVEKFGKFLKYNRKLWFDVETQTFNGNVNDIPANNPTAVSYTHLTLPTIYSV